MKNRILLIAMVLMVVSSLAVAGCPPPVPEVLETIHLRFSTWHPPAGADVLKLWIPMLEEMERRSDGRITFTMYAGGALGKGPDHYDIVMKGLSDIGYHTITWTPGRFPLTEVLSAPIMFPGKYMGVEVGMAMYERILYREFPDTKVLHLNACVHSFLYTAEKEVHTLEDIEGLRIRTWGGLGTSMLKALGAEPVFMPLGEVYLAMEMGVIDGLITCPALVMAFKLYEVSRYAVKIPFGCVAEGLFMNLDTWERVPDDLKPIIEEVGRDAYKIAGIFDEKWLEYTLAKIGEHMQFITLSPEEEERWLERFRIGLAEWVEELEGKGLPAEEALRIFHEEVQKRGVPFPACPLC
jgi:TRAP-type C4-dicarboxylate transport system substrate-binding protein